MGNFLSVKERASLRELHRRESNLRHGDRIKTILLLDANWPASKIAEALLLDKSTVYEYQKRYDSGGLESLCSDAYDGRECSLTKSELCELELELRSKIYLSASEISKWVERRFGVSFSLRGVTYLLHKLGFSYRKPNLVPGKADEVAQRDFLKKYETVKNSLKDGDKLYFVDGMHPQHNSVPGYGWLPRGEEVKLKSNTGRKRLNVSGALDSETKEIVIQEDTRLNAESSIEFFRTLERKNPKAHTIYLILDNAGYYKGEKVAEYLLNSRIKLLFLPPYAPNLNLIERVWKFFKKKILYNKYYETFEEFKFACLNFFTRKNWNAQRKALDTILSGKFNIVSA